jgi:hypothetical protein
MWPDLHENVGQLVLALSPGHEDDQEDEDKAAETEASMPIRLTPLMSILPPKNLFR